MEMGRCFIASLTLISFLIMYLIYIGNFNSDGYEYYQTDQYASNVKRTEIQDIPQAGSDNPAKNLFQMFKRGYFYFNDLINETKSTVFKVKLEEERVVIADPIAIRAIYDVTKIVKEPAAGVVAFKPIATHGYVPSGFTNGPRHMEQKRYMMEFLDNRLQAVSWENAFIKMRNELDAITQITGAELDMDAAVENLSTNVVDHILLGEATNNIGLYNEWFAQLFELKKHINPNPDNNDTEELDVANRVYKKFVEAPALKDIETLFPLRPKEELLQEIIFFVIFNTNAGLRLSMRSVLPLYAQLNSKDYNFIHKEADTFFDKNNKKSFDERLRDLDVINKFALETIRFLTPVTEVFSRAKKDFILESTSGYYQIKKGQILDGQVYATQRSPGTFRLPKSFTLTGSQNHTKMNMFAFGGPYYQTPTVTNRKCLGQQFSLNFLKFLVLHLTKYTFVPANDWSFTEINGKRLVASNQPLKVRSFVCNSRFPFYLSMYSKYNIYINTCPK